MVSLPSGIMALVFTDLDGSLLDHHSYGYEDALPQLRQLARLRVPVIFASSKTRAEIEPLRAELSIDAPFIAENGAAAYVPTGYFAAQPQQTAAVPGYWVRSWSRPREVWLQMLAELEDEFPGEFEYFQRAGTDAVAAMTGLPPVAAERANCREFSEPVRWLGSASGEAAFVERLRQRGARVQRGGRFLSVSDQCDKGGALVWLREAFRRAYPEREIHDLAVGDSGNDVDMLRAAGTALVVRSPVHDFPALEREADVLFSNAFGPEGWAEGVARWLATIAGGSAPARRG